LRRLLTGTNPVTPRKSREMIERLTAEHFAPTVLVIGGGAIGVGTDALYAEPKIRIIGTDVYASPNTQGYRMLPMRSRRKASSQPARLTF
jgi:hypothetical protein